jgi:hypothetical protein
MSRISYGITFPNLLPTVSGGPAGERRSGTDGARRGRKSGECSIGPMRRPLALIAGALAGFGLYRLLGERRRGVASPLPEEAPPGPDPRAEELRRRLEESRSLAGEREEFEAAETPVDLAEAPRVEDRRSRVHEEGRDVVERMRRYTVHE